MRKYLVAMMFVSSTSLGVTWDEQAARVQNISTAFLDGLPVGEPVRAPHMGVEGKAILSFLPKVNPKIGGKSEKVPSSPVHTLPTLQFNYADCKTNEPSLLRAQVWVAGKPAGGESLLGLKAKLSQTMFGFAAAPEFPIGDNWLVTSIGYQRTSAKIVGAITTPTSDDKLTMSTSFFYLAPGIKIPSMSLWANAMFGKKDTQSDFLIEVDGTRFKLHDSPNVGQVAAGWYGFGGIEVGLAELWVQERLIMPRLLASYQYEIN